MPVSSLIAQTRPDDLSRVAGLLSELNGVDVIPRDDGRLVIVTETSSRAEDARIWRTIEETPGILRLDLIYHNFEDMEGPIA